MDLGLRDRVYVVTGGSRGLGYATAEALVADGARVVIAARSAESVEAAATALGGSASAVGVAADLADPGAPARLVAAAQDSFGRLDGAMLSVGGPAAGTVLTATDEDWHAAFESVFLGVVRTAREVVAHLGEGGSLVLRPVVVGALPHPRARHLQRTAPGPRHGRQEPRRRGRAARHPRQRRPPRTPQHRAHRAPGRA